MQLITFKVSQVLCAYDNNIARCKRLYNEEVDRFIKQLLEYEKKPTLLRRIYNWLFKIIPVQKDVSWIRLLETSLKEKREWTKSPNFELKNDYFNRRYFIHDSFEYDLSDMIRFNRWIIEYENERKVLTNSESNTVLIDQEEAQDLGLNK